MWVGSSSIYITPCCRIKWSVYMEYKKEIAYVLVYACFTVTCDTAFSSISKCVYIVQFGMSSVVPVSLVWGKYSKSNFCLIFEDVNNYSRTMKLKYHKTADIYVTIGLAGLVIKICFWQSIILLIIIIMMIMIISNNNNNHDNNDNDHDNDNNNNGNMYNNMRWKWVDVQQCTMKVVR